jgi:ATP-dependent DNA helicase RecG
VKYEKFKSGPETDIQYLKGIGPKRAVRLNKIGIQTINDLLFLVPRRYIDRTKLVKIRELTTQAEGTIYGKIIASDVKRTKNYRDIVRIVVGDESGILEAIWFNRPDLKLTFKINQHVILSGDVTYYGHKQMVNPYYEIIPEEKSDDSPFVYTGSIVPIYPLTEGLSLWEIRRPMQNAINLYLNYLNETLPKYLLDKYKFDDIRSAITNLHFPKTIEQAQNARARLAYEELFYLELILALRKLSATHEKKSRALIEKGNLTGQLMHLLPFKLTQGQNKVLHEIKTDLARESSMNRLLQGDVGSGKTVIAIYASLIAIENNYQTAFMAPTEILAEQHYLVWHERLNKIGVNTCLLTGSTKAKNKKKHLDEIEKGMIHLVFGTHALLEEKIKFHQLGLAVIDEQHRFGVMQRATLLNKGINPDFLVMTATPIPRTLQMTLYGDLDVSILSEKPPGRKRIITRLVTNDDREKVYQFIHEKLNEMRQVYIVCPLIEESEKLDLASAIKTYEDIRSIFNNNKVGLVHGRLKSADRIMIMEEFRQHRLDILVTTTVIEVGVDISNATVMVIEHPERFGLAQLHQLRGRIGRGEQVSYCILIGSDNKFSPAYERLRFFEKNDDGFILAEKDLEFRGPGEILGTRQHGLPDLRIADLQQDRHILFQARDDAFDLIRQDPNLSKSENNIIRTTVNNKFKDRIELASVG